MLNGYNLEYLLHNLFHILPPFNIISSKQKCAERETKTEQIPLIHFNFIINRFYPTDDVSTFSSTISQYIIQYKINSIKLFVEINYNNNMTNSVTNN